MFAPFTIELPFVVEGQGYDDHLWDQWAVISALASGEVIEGCRADAFWFPYQPLVESLISRDPERAFERYNAERLHERLLSIILAGRSINPMNVHTQYYWNKVLNRHTMLIRKQKLQSMLDQFEYIDWDSVGGVLAGDSQDVETKQSRARKIALLGLAIADSIFWELLDDVDWNGCLERLATAVRFDEWDDESQQCCEEVFGVRREFGVPFHETLARGL